MATTLYWVVYADGGGTPSGAQIVAGQDSTGSAALASGSEAYTSAGTYDEATAITSLSASTAYRVAWVAYDGTSYSAVAVSAAITTSAASVPALVLLSDGRLQYSAAAAGGDRKLYLTSGAISAKTAADTGDRLITLSGGGWAAGAPA